MAEQTIQLEASWYEGGCSEVSQGWRPPTWITRPEIDTPLET